jgi:uncharacterized protein (DUF58 family)
MNIFSLGYFRSSGPFHTVGLTLIILGLVAMVHTNSNILLAQAQPVANPLAEAGAPFSLPINLSNWGADYRYNIIISLPKSFNSHKPLFLSELIDRHRSELTLKLPERGIYSLSLIKVSSRGIFGLFYAWKWCPCESELVIYPRPFGSAPLPLAHQEQSPQILDGEDFVGHKPYQPGFSLRRIDWKAFAKTDRLLLKDFHSPEAESVELNFSETPGKDIEEKLEQLTAWIFLAQSQERAFSLVLPHGSLPMGRSSSHLDSALRLLASCPRKLL